MRIEIISGSPRQNSTTLRVALFLQQLFLDEGYDGGLIDLREHHLPPMERVYFSPDEAPENIRALATRMFAADAFLIVTPEYNGSYAPAMQNLFDHFPKQQHKPFGLVTASPGALGGIRAAMKLQLFILALFGIPSPFMLIVPGVDKKFDVKGNLIDASFKKNIDVFRQEFLWLAGKLAPVPLPA
jgi:NAD(P)H-dependent FMN reductase